jgi:hypothetical protein
LFLFSDVLTLPFLYLLWEKLYIPPILEMAWHL